MYVILGRHVGLSSESLAALFVQEKAWYDQVPNLNDPYVLYATAHTEEDAQALMRTMPATVGMCEFWKQTRNLNGNVSTQPDRTG